MSIVFALSMIMQSFQVDSFFFFFMLQRNTVWLHALISQRVFSGQVKKPTSPTLVLQIFPITFRFS